MCQIYLIKDGVDRAPDDPRLALGAEHGVRLAGGGLSVGEDRGVETLRNKTNFTSRSITYGIKLHTRYNSL